MRLPHAHHARETIGQVIPNTLALSQIHALAEQGQVALALSQIEEVLRQQPGSGPAWHLAGMIRRRAGDTAGAVAALQQAIALGQARAEVWNSLGLAYEDLRDLTKAEAAFSNAVGCDATYAAAATNHARVLCRLGEHGRAEAMLRDALTRQPRAPALLNALGATLIDSGRADEAEGAYRQSLAIKSDSKVAVIRLGQALRDQGRAEEAVAFYRANRAKIGESPELIEAMAGALVESGDWHAAESELERLCAAAPGHFQAHRSLARLGREYGSDKDVYRTYRSLIAQWPGEPAVWLEWIAQLLHFRDYNMALEVIDAAEGRIPASDQLAYAKALALSETGSGGEAETQFALLSSSSLGVDQTYLTARARNAIRIKDFALAENLAAEALQRDPADQFAQAYLGVAWRLRGDARESWLHDYDIQVQQIQLEYLANPEKLEELKALLRTLHRAKGNPPDQSLRGGTQTEGALLTRAHPLLRELRGNIEAAVADYIGRMPDDPDHPMYRRKKAQFRFAGSWSVRLASAGFHIAHIHSEGWISSALHLTVPPRLANESPDAGALVLGEPPAELECALPPRRVVAPKVGHLALFPSSMWHGTKPFTNDAERLTVAFDVVPG